MKVETLEDQIAECFKKYKKLSESTNIADEVRLEKVGNQLEYLLQLKQNQEQEESN